MYNIIYFSWKQHYVWWNASQNWVQEMFKTSEEIFGTFLEIIFGYDFFLYLEILALPG